MPSDPAQASSLWHPGSRRKDVSPDPAGAVIEPVDRGGLGACDPRAHRIAALRQTLARLESVTAGAAPNRLRFGIPDMDERLPGGGIAYGVLHEMAAAAHGDRPSALGFLATLVAAGLAARRGPAILVVSRRWLQDGGEPYGHGLAWLGIDPGRLVLVHARNDRDALWAIEESLRSKDAGAAVAGAIASGLDLTTSRRLNLAAAASGLPLLLLRAPRTTGASAAATRWCIAAAPAAQDRFGAFAHVRWRVVLERSRNGRTGAWLLEWDHAAYRFHLAEVVAGHTPVARASPQKLRHIG